MPSEAEIYQRHAEAYARLVAREDYQGNILRALEEITSLAGLDAVELGAGTGRLTGLLAPRVRSIVACDASRHMLSAAARQLAQSGFHNWRLLVADHRSLPLPDACADLAISGWSIAYLKVWGGRGWRAQVGKALREMLRTLRPGGKTVILETLGTGSEQPVRPKKLAAYYRFLEEQGFAWRWLRTDYRFEDLAEARELAGFFFGEAMRRQVVEKNWVILPECTGIWFSPTENSSLG
jgi:ubiquinone/menaquinone biosynthesis C-methylase UbiE